MIIGIVDDASEKGLYPAWVAVALKINTIGAKPSALRFIEIVVTYCESKGTGSYS